MQPCSTSFDVHLVGDEPNILIVVCALDSKGAGIFQDPLGGAIAVTEQLVCRAGGHHAHVIGPAGW